VKTSSGLLLVFLTAGVAQGQTWGPSANMGISGGPALYQSLPCPSGKHAIGLQVYAGIWVHGLRLECAALGPNGEHESAVMVAGTIGTDNNGTVKQLRCSGGEVLVGSRGRLGWWIDRIEIACKHWNRANGGAEGSVSWRGAAGGTGGDAYGPLYCPDKYGVNRVDGNGLFAVFPNPPTLGRYYFYCRGV
jgi:hypothetical protein